jgi:uncharacterized protein (DUF1684 family)
MNPPPRNPAIGGPVLPAVAAVLSLALVGCGGPPAPEKASADGGASYASEIEAWRQERVQRLRAETGWLSLVGLDWLEPGENRFGADEDNDIVFPEGTAPALAGSLFLEDGSVRLVPAEGVLVVVNDERSEGGDLASDARGEPDVVRIGDLVFYVISRGGRLAVRSKHPGAPARLAFEGIDFYDIDPEYRVTATFEPHDEPREVAVPTVLDQPETMTAPGLLRFTLGGQECTLEPMLSGQDYFIIFKDSTSGNETYPAGRFLYAAAAVDGVATLDFNRAYNPPCAFTPYATCPLPPRQNWLEIAVEAGEKDYGAHP